MMNIEKVRLPLQRWSKVDGEEADRRIKIRAKKIKIKKED